MRKLALLFATLLLCAGAVFGQGKTVSGTVMSSVDNLPVIGAAVQVKGAESVGTITDFDGKFTITLPEGSTTLVVSFMGLQTQEVVAQNGMVITLNEESTVMDEVMVVAYGTSTKKAFTGSAEVVKGETIERKNPSEVSKALAGEVAGVQVVTSSGQPGSTATINIRGIGSVNSSTAPLYVVDGIPYDGDISSIDPSDIASTTILKDATATSLYGARGANGVILITTKKGTAGESGKIDVDVKYGANMRLIPLYETIQDPQQFVEMAWQGLYNNYVVTGSDPATAGRRASQAVFSNSCIPEKYNMWTTTGVQLIDPNTGKFYPDAQLKQGYIDQPLSSWEDNIFRIGQKLDASVKIHGGSDKTTYYTSIGYLMDEGYYLGSDFNRFTARANVDHQAKKWLKGSMNMSYTYSTYNNPGQETDGTMNNGFLYVNGIAPIYPVFERDENGYKIEDTQVGGYKYDYGMSQGVARLFGSGINPAGSLQLDRQYTQQHQFAGNAMLEATFYKGLKLTATIGMQYINADLHQLKNAYYGDAQGVGRLTHQIGQQLSLTANQILSYTATFANDHNFDAFVGHESQLYTQAYMYGMKNYSARPDGIWLSNFTEMSAIESYSDSYALESYLGQVRYNYKERYFFHGSIRADGSSRFAKGHRWGTFGSVGLAWLISNEDFMQNVNLLRNFKLRASWGVLGNQNIPLYLVTDLYGIGIFNGRPAYTWGSYGSGDLTWESSQQWDVGVEFDLGKYLTTSIDYFHRTTTNMLFSRATAPSLGYGSYYVNEGRLAVQGVEFQFNVHAVNTRNVKLDIRLNGAHYQDRMLEMPLNADGTEMYQSGSLAKGHSQLEWYLPTFMGVDDATGQAMYKYYYYENADGTQEIILNPYTERLRHPERVDDLKEGITADYTQAGSDYVGKTAVADLQGGFGFDLSLYGFDISASFMYGIGGWGYDNIYASQMNSDRAGTNNWHVDMLDAWTPDNPTSEIPKLSNGNDYYNNSGSTQFLTSNSYLTLSNVRIGYSFPKKWMEKIMLNNLNIWVSGDNLFCLSARRGYIPFSSIDGSSGTANYAPMSTVMCGIKLQF